MISAQALSLLALRRFTGRQAAVPVAAGAARHGPGSNGHANGPPPAAPDGPALADALRRAVDRAWLALELLFCHDAVEGKLSGPEREALDALLDNACFDHLAATPGPF